LYWSPELIFFVRLVRNLKSETVPFIRFSDYHVGIDFPRAGSPWSIFLRFEGALNTDLHSLMADWSKELSGCRYFLATGSSMVLELNVAGKNTQRDQVQKNEVPYPGAFVPHIAVMYKTNLNAKRCIHLFSTHKIVIDGISLNRDHRAHDNTTAYSSYKNSTLSVLRHVVAVD
jgi:hypothetical protein